MSTSIVASNSRNLLPCVILWVHCGTINQKLLLRRCWLREVLNTHNSVRFYYYNVNTNLYWRRKGEADSTAILWRSSLSAHIYGISNPFMSAHTQRRGNPSQEKQSYFQCQYLYLLSIRMRILAVIVTLPVSFFL